jgi:cytoskeletal protein CcmA (bactofilin family)
MTMNPSNSNHSKYGQPLTSGQPNQPSQSNQPNQVSQPGKTSLGQAMPDVLKTPVLTQVAPAETVKPADGNVAKQSITPSTPNYVASSPSATQSGGSPSSLDAPQPSKADKLCMIEEGITFTGNVALQGICTIAGQVIGNLKEQANATSQIVITETGSVKGDIFSNKVSVMGTSNGTIDASGGSVDLHAKSVVNGHIRYGQLQVNGADLNATLERVQKPVK